MKLSGTSLPVTIGYPAMAKGCDFNGVAWMRAILLTCWYGGHTWRREHQRIELIHRQRSVDPIVPPHFVVILQRRKV